MLLKIRLVVSVLRSVSNNKQTSPQLNLDTVHYRSIQTICAINIRTTPWKVHCIIHCVSLNATDYPIVTDSIYTLYISIKSGVSMWTECWDVASSAPKFSLVITLPASLSATKSPHTNPRAFTSAKAVAARASVVCKDEFVTFYPESVWIRDYLSWVSVIRARIM